MIDLIELVTTSIQYSFIAFLLVGSALTPVIMKAKASKLEKARQERVNALAQKLSC